MIAVVMKTIRRGEVAVVALVNVDTKTNTIDKLLIHPKHVTSKLAAKDYVVVWLDVENSGVDKIGLDTDRIFRGSAVQYPDLRETNPAKIKTFGFLDTTPISL